MAGEIEPLGPEQAPPDVVPDGGPLEAPLTETESPDQPDVLAMLQEAARDAGSATQAAIDTAEQLKRVTSAGPLEELSAILTVAERLRGLVEADLESIGLTAASGVSNAQSALDALAEVGGLVANSTDQRPHGLDPDAVASLEIAVDSAQQARVIGSTEYAEDIGALVEQARRIGNQIEWVAQAVAALRLSASEVKANGYVIAAHLAAAEADTGSAWAEACHSVIGPTGGNISSSDASEATAAPTTPPDGTRYDH